MSSGLRSEQAWLELARARVLRGEYAEAESATLQASPASICRLVANPTPNRCCGNC